MLTDNIGHFGSVSGKFDNICLQVILSALALSLQIRYQHCLKNICLDADIMVTDNIVIFLEYWGEIPWTTNVDRDYFVSL